MTVRPPQPSPGTPPLTWAIWVVALSPLLSLVAIAIMDVDGYFRGTVELALAARTGTTGGIPASLAGSLFSITLGSLLGLVVTIASIVFAAVDWRILRARGIDRPFHWAWSFFVLLSLGGLVYPIGRTVVARRRTGRSASAPLWVFVALTVVVLIVTTVKIASAFSVFAGYVAELSRLS